MVQLEENKLTITIECEDPTQMLHRIRKSITEVTTILVESDEFYYHQDLPEAITALIKMQGELCTE